jgi:hypothetical protein
MHKLNQINGVSRYDLHFFTFILLLRERKWAFKWMQILKNYF